MAEPTFLPQGQALLPTAAAASEVATPSSSTIATASSSTAGTSPSSTPTATATAAPTTTTNTGLSRGAEAGIAIGSIAFLMLICASLLFILKNRRSKSALAAISKQRRVGTMKAEARETDADSGFEEGLVSPGMFGGGVGREGSVMSGGMMSGGMMSGGMMSNISGIGGRVRGGMGGMARIWHRDGLERVGRYEDAERGLPLPWIDGMGDTQSVRGQRGKAKVRGWSMGV